MQAMILAAGFGTRLLPYTKFRPKPLFPILNSPLLLLTIKRLKKQGFTKIIVNSHYLGEQIERAVADIDGVCLQKEEIILGTGGGLRRALATMEDAPVLITNGDIYHTISYAEIFKKHLEHSAPITLGVHDYPRFNVLEVLEDSVLGFEGKLTRQNSQLLAFTGLHVIEPDMLESIVPDEKSCILDCYRTHLKKGVVIHGHRCDGNFWTDMGTVPDYLELHKGLLKGTFPLVEELQCQSACFHRGENVQLGKKVEVNDWSVVGNNVIIGNDVVLKGSVVWDDAVIPEGSRVEETILVQ